MLHVSVTDSLPGQNTALKTGENPFSKLSEEAVKYGHPSTGEKW